MVRRIKKNETKNELQSPSSGRSVTDAFRMCMSWIVDIVKRTGNFLPHKFCVDVDYDSCASFYRDYARTFLMRVMTQLSRSRFYDCFAQFACYVKFPAHKAFAVCTVCDDFKLQKQKAQNPVCLSWSIYL